MSQPYQAFAETVGESLTSSGMTVRTLCPACDGGASRERTFIVGREHGRLWWMCHRATCYIRGITGDASMPALNNALRNLVPILRPYEGSVLPAEQKDVAWFAERFDINFRTVGQHVRVSEHDEYVLPYRDSMGNLRGYVVRQPRWSGEPAPVRAGVPQFSGKVKTYRHTTEPTLGWYRPAEPTSRLVLVEDQISAMKIAQIGLNAVALLGTSLSAAGVLDICRFKPHSVLIALDPGAEDAAHQLRLRWGGYFARCRLVMLPADPKDIPIADLSSELGL